MIMKIINQFEFGSILQEYLNNNKYKLIFLINNVIYIFSTFKKGTLN